ncbi:MAG: gliding motility-associated C-terminal domain-containing protein [Bacteroidia bacterium]|nr:gliding motility-associated C-terminal domain-containing protein [Bacteroidia bacterium]
MKIKLFIILFLGLSFTKLYSQMPNRGCATAVPSAQYDSLLQQQVLDYLNNSSAASRVQTTYQIPVIIHVIHNGQAVGTYPNLAQGQLNSQIQVLNDDYAGTGFNTGTYPATAFQTYATNTVIAAASKDGLGRIGISNTGITFCLAGKDSLGNTLAEPGIERKHWNTIAGASNPTTFTTAATYMSFMDNVIKPSTIWSPNKYLNIWVTDISSSIILAYSTFPTLSTLAGLSGGGTATTDGLVCKATAFGSQNIFPSGTYDPVYKYGRTITHELSHYLGVKHIWGDAACASDFCNDTPPAQGATYNTQTYPYLPNNCPTNLPATGPNGVMFMNFADYTDDVAMYMFTDEQKTRMQTTMLNSPYRKLLGTHGLCFALNANFLLSSTSINAGQSVSITDLSTSTSSITSWNYSCAAATPTSSTLQNPSFTFNSIGTHTITLTVNSSGVFASTTKTIQVSACPTPTVTLNTTSPSCNGLCNGIASINTAGGAPFTYIWSPAVASSSIATNLCAGNYSCVVTNSCGVSVTKPVVVSQPSPINITIFPSSTVVCVGDGVDLTASVSGGTGTTYTFNWSNGASVSSTSVIPTITPSVNYTVNVQDLNGCVKSSVITISVNPLPSVTVTPGNQTICAGKTATLNLSGALNYTTNPGNTTLSSFTVSPTATTIYTVTGVSPFGCVGIRRDTVKVNSLPSVFSNVNTNTVCLGGLVTFSNLGANTFTVFPSSATGSLVSVPVNTLGTTIYTVAGTGPFGCINTKTISITSFSLPIVSITPSVATICSGQFITLSVSGANTYTWTTGSSLNNISVSPLSSTSYSVIGKNSFGCENSAFSNVNVVNTPIVTINSPSVNVCMGYTMTIVANGAANYSWSTGATTNTVFVQPFVNTTYSVVGTNVGTCSDTAIVSLSVLPLPSVSATANTTLACVGQTINLTASGNASIYYWQPSGLVGANQSLQITAPTTYTAVGQGTNGCLFFSTVFVDVQNGTAVIPVATPSAVCVGDSSVLSVIGGTVPTWSVNAIPNTSIVTPTVNSSYTLSAVDFNGCVSDIVYTVDINADCDVIVYNGFTPNGDGVNDFWIIDNIDRFPNNKVYVFNRWGNRLFNTVNYNNVDNKWDGKINGRAVSAGTYFYILLDDTEKLLKKGWIEITN